MNYSIKEVAEITGLSAYTLRYYEKEDILKNIKRNEKGVRVYEEHDLELLHVITCLKETGMSLINIKDYVQMCRDGSDTFAIRYTIFEKQKEELEKQISTLERHLETANYKMWYYKNIEELGNEDDPNNCEKMKKIYEGLQ